MLLKTKMVNHNLVKFLTITLVFFLVNKVLANDNNLPDVKSFQLPVKDINPNDGHAWQDKQDFGTYNDDWDGYHIAEDWNYGSRNLDANKPVYSIGNGKIKKIDEKDSIYKDFQNTKKIDNNNHKLTLWAWPKRKKLNKDDVLKLEKGNKVVKVKVVAYNKNERTIKFEYKDENNKIECEKIHGNLCKDWKVSKWIDPKKRRGGYMIIEHKFNDKKYYSLYWHIDPNDDLKEGEIIKKGKEIGKITDLTNSIYKDDGMFSHLHFAIMDETGYECYTSDNCNVLNSNNYAIGAYEKIDYTAQLDSKDKKITFNELPNSIKEGTTIYIGSSKIKAKIGKINKKSKTAKLSTVGENCKKEKIYPIPDHIHKKSVNTEESYIYIWKSASELDKSHISINKGDILKLKNIKDPEDNIIKAEIEKINEEEVANISKSKETKITLKALENELNITGSDRDYSISICKTLDSLNTKEIPVFVYKNGKERLKDNGFYDPSDFIEKRNQNNNNTVLDSSDGSGTVIGDSADKSEPDAVGKSLVTESNDNKDNCEIVQYTMPNSRIIEDNSIGLWTEASNYKTRLKIGDTIKICKGNNIIIAYVKKIKNKDITNEKETNSLESILKVDVLKGESNAELNDIGYNWEIYKCDFNVKVKNYYDDIHQQCQDPIKGHKPIYNERPKFNPIFDK